MDRHEDSIAFSLNIDRNNHHHRVLDALTVGPDPWVGRKPNIRKGTVLEADQTMDVQVVHHEIMQPPFCRRVIFITKFKAP